MNAVERVMSGVHMSLAARVIGLLFVSSLSIAASAVASEPDVRGTRQLADADDRLGDSIRALELPRVPAENAALIAEHFVAETAAASRPEWLGAQVGTPTLFVTSARQPILYEFPVFVPGLARGSVFIGATEGLSSVASYTTEGASVAATLRESLAARSGVATGASGTETYYYGGIGRFGISADGSGTTNALHDDRGNAVAVYAPDLDPRSWTEWRAYFAADIRVTRAFVDAERAVRASYVTEGTRGDRRIQSNSTLRAQVESNRAVGGGIGAFAHYYQENRTWSKGTCYAGCAPVAAAILLQYWDRNGYPGLISSPQDNDNWSVTDGDVRWTIDQLRQKMGTTCSGTSGSTNVASVGPGLQSYITSRGANLTASNTSFLMWSRIIDEINVGRPVLLHFQLSNKAGHSAVVYEYTDNWFTSNDWVCVANGWTGTPWNCYNVTSPTEPWYAITRVQK